MHSPSFLPSFFPRCCEFERTIPNLSQTQCVDIIIFCQIRSGVRQNPSADKLPILRQEGESDCVSRQKKGSWKQPGNSYPTLCPRSFCPRKETAVDNHTPKMVERSRLCNFALRPKMYPRLFSRLSFFLRHAAVSIERDKLICIRQ
jgi:hypothetical protein